MKATASNTALPLFYRILIWVNYLVAFLLIGSYIATHISPESLPYLAFLGLGYPVLLLLAILFVLLWFFKRKKLMLISVVAIALGFSHLRHFIGITFWQADLSEPVKVMSYNVRIFDFFNLEGRIENRNRIFDFLKGENPDIICFQEFFHQERSSDFETRDSLIELLEFPYLHEHYTHNMALSRYFGLATFSKYPIISKGEISFENDDNNYCIYSDIVIRQDTIRVFNGHIGSIRFQNDDYDFFGEEGRGRYIDRDAGQQILSRLKLAFEKRAVQARRICEFVEASPYPVVLCMDMNDTPVSYAYRRFSRLLTDAFVRSGNGLGNTYVGKMPSNRIDYIFHADELRSANFVTHDVEYSDHRPVSCEIEVNRKP